MPLQSLPRTTVLNWVGEETHLKTTALNWVALQSLVGAAALNLGVIPLPAPGQSCSPHDEVTSDDDAPDKALKLLP